MNDKNLKHFGVLGMRWGIRRGQLVRKNTMGTKKRQEGLDRAELSILKTKKALGSSHQKKINEKKIEILTRRLNNVDKTKLQQRYSHVKDKSLKNLRGLDEARKKEAKKSVANALLLIGTVALLDRTFGKGLKL